MDTPSLLTEAIAASIQSAMTRAGLTTNSLAQAAGIPYVTLHRKLGGLKPFTTIELGAIAQALGTTASALLREAELAA